ncbi:MAG: hypothetical protein ACRCUT_14430 [Spirochaetota bacterium]
MEKKLSDIIREWVLENKKFFWKYEVSSYYQTYKVSIGNLPDPSKEDIGVLPHNGLLNTKKTQLCAALKKACSKSEGLSKSSIYVKVDYVDGNVVVAVI